MALADFLLKGSIHKVPYKGRDGKEYMFGIYRHVIDVDDSLGTDRLYLLYNDGGLFRIVGKYNFGAIKGGNYYTYDTLNGTVFLSSKNLDQASNSIQAGVFYFYINEEGSFISGFIDNSPAGDYLIAAKGRLFVSGETSDYNYGGTCTLTNGSTIVTPAKQATTHRARADNIATLTLNITAMPMIWKVGDKIKITLVGESSYNSDSAVITAVSGVTISYINDGDDETLTADTAGRVEPDWINSTRAGDFINVVVPYSFIIASGTTITTLPAVGDTYTVNSSTFLILRILLNDEGSDKYNGAIYCSRSIGTNEPSASGSLTKATGSGSNITYASVTTPSPMYNIPGTWSEIKKVNANNTIALTSAYDGGTSLVGCYLMKRTREDVIFHSAEDPLEDWNVSGQYGGDNSGFFMVKAPVTGLHNYDDAVLVFTRENGYFIEGTNMDDWQTPKNTKLPVGCICHKSIVSKNKWLGWMSDKGYFISKGGALNFSDLQGEAYSELIQRTIDDVDIDLIIAKRMFAYIYKQFLFLSVCSKEVYLSEEDSEQIFSADRITCSNTTVSIDDGDSPYSATATIGNVSIVCDTSSGNIAITLPDAASNTAIYQITKTDSSNSLTITGYSTDNLVLGYSTYTLNTATSLVFHSDGTNWVKTNPYSTITSTHSTTSRKKTGYAATLTIGTHYFVAGDQIYVSGLAEDAYNGTWTITAVDSTTITYNCDTSGDESSTADTDGVVSPAFVGNIQPGDLLRIGVNYYNITSVVDNTAFIINELIGDLTASEYVIVKRRNNRLLTLDTRTNVKKKSYGWTVFDNVNVDSFCELDGDLYYASSTTPNIFKYDTGGQLYGADFNASFTTRKEDCGLKGVIKYFKSLEVKCKGIGRLYIIPYIDGVAKDEMCIDVNNNYYESFYFPNALNSDATVDNYPKNCFSGQGETIQIYFELRGSNETLAILPPEIGYIPLSRRMA